MLGVPDPLLLCEAMLDTLPIRSFATIDELEVHFHSFKVLTGAFATEKSIAGGRTQSRIAAVADDARLREILRRSA